jgi:hypothetical protein
LGDIIDFFKLFQFFSVSELCSYIAVDFGQLFHNIIRIYQFECSIIFGFLKRGYKLQ